MQNVVVSSTGEGSESLNKNLATLCSKPIMFDENLSVCVDWGGANTKVSLSWSVTVPVKVSAQKVRSDLSFLNLPSRDRRVNQK